MLHGNPTWSFYYRDLVLALRGCPSLHRARSHRLRPVRQAGDDRYDYTLRRRIDDLERLLDHLRIDGNVTLVLHDWGGMIGMGYAARHPERIGRLVILNTAAFHLPTGKAFPQALWVCRKTPLGPLLIRGLNLFCRSAAKHCVVRPMSDAVRAGYLRRTIRGGIASPCADSCRTSR